MGRVLYIIYRIDLLLLIDCLDSSCADRLDQSEGLELVDRNRFHLPWTN